MLFTQNTEYIDIKKTGYISINNYKLANQVIMADYCMPFYFPDIYELVNTADFIIQKIEINRYTGGITLTNAYTLDSDNKNDNYFEGENLDTNLTIGDYYILKLDSTTPYYSKNIFKCVASEDLIFENYFIDNEDDYLIDNNGDKFTEPLMK